jgi:hypothetical protein
MTVQQNTNRNNNNLKAKVLNTLIHKNVNNKIFQQILFLIQKETNKNHVLARFLQDIQSNPMWKEGAPPNFKVSGVYTFVLKNSNGTVSISPILQYKNNKKFINLNGGELNMANKEILYYTIK